MNFCFLCYIVLFIKEKLQDRKRGAIIFKIGNQNFIMHFMWVSLIDNFKPIQTRARFCICTTHDPRDKMHLLSFKLNILVYLTRETRHYHLARKFEEVKIVGCQMKRKLAYQEVFFAICYVLSRNFFANSHAFGIPFYLPLCFTGYHFWIDKISSNPRLN
jgi:hypothetical protein